MRTAVMGVRGSGDAVLLPPHAHPLPQAFPSLIYTSLPSAPNQTFLLSVSTVKTPLSVIQAGIVNVGVAGAGYVTGFGKASSNLAAEVKPRSFCT